MARLTDGDRKILHLAWQCFKEPPQVNYNKLQKIGGYKTTASATSVYLVAKKKVRDDSSPELTEGERSVLDKALYCVVDLPKVDYKKMQEKGGYKTAASATAVYLAAKKKLLAGAGLEDVTPVKKGGKKRKAAKIDDDEEAEEDMDADVTEEDAGKKPKKRAKKAASKGVWSQDAEFASLVDPNADVKPKQKKKGGKKGEGVWSQDQEFASLLDQKTDAKPKKKKKGEKKAEKKADEEEHTLGNEDVYMNLFASTSDPVEDPEDEKT